MITWIKEHLVPEAKDWWRWASIRVNALGAAIMAWVWFDPVGVLAVWNMLPLPMVRSIPPSVVYGIGAVLFVLAMIMRVTTFRKGFKHDDA